MLGLRLLPVEQAMVRSNEITHVQFLFLCHADFQKGPGLCRAWGNKNIPGTLEEDTMVQRQAQALDPQAPVLHRLQTSLMIMLWTKSLCIFHV
jgi:hypothetical protein